MVMRYDFVLHAFHFFRSESHACGLAPFVNDDVSLVIEYYSRFESLVLAYVVFNAYHFLIEWRIASVKDLYLLVSVYYEIGHLLGQ